MNILLEAANLGDHILAIYSDKEKELDDALSFGWSGFKNNEVVFILTTLNTNNEEIRRKIRSRWKLDNIEELEAAGDIVIRTAREWYFAEGTLDPKKAMAKWKDTVDDAIARGKKGLRAFASASELFKDGLESKFLEYEETLERHFSFPITCICSYIAEDVESMSSNQLAALRAHHNFVVVDNAHGYLQTDVATGKIIVVDDEPDIVLILKRGLEGYRNDDFKFSVDAFTNPELALEQFRHHPNDYFVAILDLRMPGMSGLALAPKLKALNPHIRIIIATAFEIKEEPYLSLMPAGTVDQFLSKPVRMGNLGDIVAKLLLGRARELETRREDDCLAKLGDTESNEHNILIYEDVNRFREIYTEAVKRLIGDQIVLIVTHYETIERVRNNLKDAGIDVEKHEREGSLVFVDSEEGYQVDSFGVMKLAQSLVERAEKEGKKGVTAFGDPGSFFMYQRLEALFDYELSLPSKFPLKFRAFCSYHQKDFETLTEEQRQIMIRHHHRKVS